MFPYLYGDTVVQHVAGTPTTDAYGNEVEAFTDRTLTGVVVFPGNSAENLAGVDVVLGDMALLAPAGVTIGSEDEFTLADGNRYKVNGAAQTYKHPATGSGGVQVMLRRRT